MDTSRGKLLIEINIVGQPRFPLTLSQTESKQGRRVAYYLHPHFKAPCVTFGIALFFAFCAAFSDSFIKYLSFKNSGGSITREIKNLLNPGHACILMCLFKPVTC